MSNQTEEYLEVLYTLTENRKTAKTTAIAKKLKISPASVTEMIQKLSKEGYLEYKAYKGVILTEKGKKIGKKMTRKHRLLEKFLHEHLKIKKENVHKEACELEHGLSDASECAICKLLNQPERCPDDEKKIPDCEKEVLDEDCKIKIKKNRY